jgi:hypothetical protein
MHDPKDDRSFSNGNAGEGCTADWYAGHTDQKYLTHWWVRS